MTELTNENEMVAELQIRIAELESQLREKTVLLEMTQELIQAWESSHKKAMTAILLRVYETLPKDPKCRAEFIAKQPEESCRKIIQDAISANESPDPAESFIAKTEDRKTADTLPDVVAGAIKSNPQHTIVVMGAVLAWLIIAGLVAFVMLLVGFNLQFSRLGIPYIVPNN